MDGKGNSELSLLGVIALIPQNFVSIQYFLADAIDVVAC